jgi:hypothetical protein
MCRERRRLCPFDSLIYLSKWEAVSLGLPIQSRATHTREHGGPPLIALSPFRGQLDMSLLHGRNA